MKGLKQMFVLSVKMSREKAVGLVCVALAAAAIITAGLTYGGSDKALTAGVFRGQTNEQRLEYIASLGWEVEPDATLISIVVPEELDGVYEKYNALQLSQGFDLRNYRGRKLSRCTYTLKNYPAEKLTQTEKDSPVHLSLLVYEDVIVGGDISSAALGGFVSGLEKK